MTYQKILKWTETHLFTQKEAPADAEIPSHKLLMRSGFMKKLAPGIYSYSTIGLRALRKFETIIREELHKARGIEILMPMVQPKELWMETNRWNEMGAGLLKFKNRNNHDFCLGATHEEAVVDYVRHDLKSYRDLPKNIYQIQTKYRDEIRPRFGLMRGREFVMKDAYSFDMDQAAALKSYDDMYKAYQRIFDRLNLQYRIVQADAGNIGGSQTHEFQLLAEAGEDHLLVSDTTQFAANIEVCPAMDFEAVVKKDEETKPLEKFATPGQKTISDLEKFTKVPANELVKTLFFTIHEDAPAGKNIELKPITVLLRGSDELNPIKLKNILSLANPPVMLSEEQVFELTGAHPGSCGPVGLKIPVYIDTGLAHFQNFIVGANQDDFHYKNVNFIRDFQVTQVADLRFAKEGDKCPESSGKLKSYRGIEVGHVFYLGKKYSEKMNGVFLDKNGRSQHYEMGCYGIGVTRTVQAAIEQSHDQDGIIWPQSISPFQVHICHLDIKDPTTTEFVHQLAGKLAAKNIEVFIDDRDERPGVKFKDADLLGFPIRVVVGKKGFENNSLEVVERKNKTIHKLAISDVEAKILELI
jgi:prolyl-tRNA synthetase